MKSDLHRFFIYCAVIFVILMILKGCPSPQEIIHKAVNESAPQIDTVQTEANNAISVPKKLPDFIHRDSVRLNNEMPYSTTVEKLIYTLGKPDTILLEVNKDKRFKKSLKSSDSLSVYHFKNSTFSSYKEKIEWNYIDFRNLRFILSTGRHKINNKTDLSTFRTFYPEVANQAFEGIDEITRTKVIQVHVPEFENSSSYWVISFLNNSLVGMRLIDK